ETPQESERPLIAGVFKNRLRRGMPLECDPTVIYALELAGRYNGALGATDMRFASPYNTYLNKGLPPGPIANPGEASLRAAYDPQKTDYFYFVANTMGGHFFSKTLAEHNAQVARYRRLREQQEKKQSGDASTGKPAAAARPSHRRG
ncbi:MAG TPA: endolytic transglycosylase MltG, partial [Methylomirabilota bacterium]|nr:endolytic transglycosylase MltG [Methylomirabilota bacterium]